MSDSIRDRFLKDHELSLEDLEKVTGGTGDVFEQNPDGTYNLYDGQVFLLGATSYTVMGTYPNATLNTHIHLEYFLETISLNGERSLDFGSCYLSLSSILTDMNMK